MQEPDDMETDARMTCGKWRLEKEIGHGAYGRVYLAAGPGGERAAVKVCRRDDIGEERYGRELRGAKLYSAIPLHDGLVRVRRLVEEAWGFYMVMDLADDEFGGSRETQAGYRPKTLASVIEGEKALPLKECLKLALSLANGLAALQRHHLLHRDIKPANVLYIKGRPALSDPGLVVEEDYAVSTVGTPVYVPPEGKFTTPASDIYSLGQTLKAASFGRRMEELDKGPAMEADTGAMLFPAWWRILNKATDATPSRRYQSAKALIKDIKMLRIKVSVMSKLGSRTANVAILAALIAAAASVAALVASNKEMNDEVASQKEEIAKQQKESSVQRAEIDRQNREMAVQRVKIAQQDNEMAAQRERIARQDNEMAAQRDEMSRQGKELEKQREEIAAERGNISEQMKALARQREEIASQRQEISRQKEEISRQAEKIAAQIDAGSLSKENATNLTSDIVYVRDLKRQMRLAKYINDAVTSLGNAIKESLNVYRASRALCGVWQYHIDNAADEGEKNGLIKVKPELTELRKRLRNDLIGLYRLINSLEAKVKTGEGDSSIRKAAEETRAGTRKLLEDIAECEKRMCEIGGLVYGDGWRPDPIWSGMAGDFWDEQSIRRAAGLPY